MPKTDPDLFCCELSLELNEPLYGTALEREVWLLLEYDAPWTARATSDNQLPPAVQSWLDAQLDVTGDNGRVQFIRQENVAARSGPAFFVAFPCDDGPRLYRFELEQYQDLLEINLSRLFAREAGYEQHRHRDPLYLVCTNGRRDRCCALYGLELYRALVAVAGEAVWQTTHVGGHRFAANVATFPDGTYYGRVLPTEAAALVATHQRGALFLERMRGRVCYEQVVQAADYFLRSESSRVGVHDFRHVATANPAEDLWEIQFEEAGAGRIHTIRLHRHLSDRPIHASCGKPQTKPVWEYQFLEHDILNNDQ
jgi:hypothetical protein